MENETIIETQPGEFDRMIAEMRRGDQPTLSSLGWKAFFFLVGIAVGFALLKSV